MKYIEIIEQLCNEYKSIIEHLSNTDDLTKWGVIVQVVPKESRENIFNIAEPRWIERKITDGTLLLNPKVCKELSARNFKPLSVHRKMVWASTLVMLEGANSKERFDTIKNMIIKKHSNIWWFDVYKRLKPTYVAKSMLKNKKIKNASSFAVKHSLFLCSVEQSERIKALENIPSG